MGGFACMRERAVHSHVGLGNMVEPGSNCSQMKMQPWLRLWLPYMGSDHRLERGGSTGHGELSPVVGGETGLLIH